MTNARGDRATLMSRVQDAVSDTFKTAEPAGNGTFVSLPFYSYNIPGTEDISEDEAIAASGGTAFPGEIVPGLRSVGGSLEVPLGFASIGWHLAAMFGAPTTTGSDPNYQHVFEAGATQTPRYLTNGITFADISAHRRTVGVTYTEMSIAARKDGQKSRVTFSAVGHDDEKVGATLDATPDTGYLGEFVPTNFQATLQRDGSTVTDVTQFDLTVGTGIEPDQETINGLDTADEVILGQWSGTGTITTRFRDTSWLDLADAATLFDLVVTWPKDADEELAMRVHNVRIARTGVDINSRGVLSVPFNFQVAQPDAADVPFRFTLKNQIADYDNL